MYLSANVYSGGGYEHVRKSDIPEDKSEVRVYDAALKALGLQNGDFPELKSVEIRLSIGYWRKANAIHRWFVNQHGGGVDKCQPIDVGREDLQALLAAAESILATVVKGEAVIEEGLFGKYESYPDATLDEELAAELLPSQAGFFFGSTEYDYSYVMDLESTVHQLKAILGHKKLANVGDFTYQASW